MRCLSKRGEGTYSACQTISETTNAVVQLQIFVASLPQPFLFACATLATYTTHAARNHHAGVKSIMACCTNYCSWTLSVIYNYIFCFYDFAEHTQNSNAALWYAAHHNPPHKQRKQQSEKCYFTYSPLLIYTIIRNILKRFVLQVIHVLQIGVSHISKCWYELQHVSPSGSTIWITFHFRGYIVN